MKAEGGRGERGREGGRGREKGRAREMVVVVLKMSLSSTAAILAKRLEWRGKGEEP